MSFLQETKDAIQSMIDKNHSGNLSAFAKSIKFSQDRLWKFLNGTHGMNSIALGEILDKIGAKISFPGDRKDKTKNCIFINTTKTTQNGKSPDIPSEDYKAVPLIDMPVAAGPGLFSEESIRSWVLVYSLHPSVRMKTNLIAVEIGRGQRSMIPTLHPQDIVLVDLDEKSPGSSNCMYLVKEPDGSVMVKRVSIEIRSGKTHLIFYSDNAQEYPPSMYVLEDDYQGDIEKAVVGKILWAWSDMSQK